MVSALAGLDPEAVHDQLSDIYSTPHKDRDLVVVTRRYVFLNKKIIKSIITRCAANDYLKKIILFKNFSLLEKISIYTFLGESLQDFSLFAIAVPGPVD